MDDECKTVCFYTKKSFSSVFVYINVKKRMNYLLDKVTPQSCYKTGNTRHERVLVFSVCKNGQTGIATAGGARNLWLNI